MTVRLHRPLVMLAALAACWAVVPLRAADVIPPVLTDAADELPVTTIADDRIVLAPDADSAPSPPEAVPAPAATETILTDEPLAEAMSVAEPRVLEVSSQAFDGMLMDEFGVDEMPFEASSGRWFWNGGWYVGGESLWMDRSREIRTVIAKDTVLLPYARGFKEPAYTTNAQPFNVAPGARVTLGKSLGRDYLDRDQAFEFVYYGGMTFNNNIAFNSISPTGFIIPLSYNNAYGFTGAGTANTQFNSDFNSWEWNYKLRRRLGRDQLVMSPGGTWTRHAERGWLPALITGVRLANVNEDFRLKTSNPPAGIPPGKQFSGDYVINTANWLLGVNLGGELISQNEFYYWGLRGRAAPCLTFANMNQQAWGINTTGEPAKSQGSFSFTEQGSQTAAGFIGDLTLLAGWQINPNFSLQVGYDFLWVGGMASAIRQFNLDQRASRTLDVGGQTFYNGVSFGFNGSW